jgi:hypothetical protein
VKTYKAGQSIPDSATYLGCVGEGVNAWYAYIL